jgi:hypothetical protein
MNPIPYQTPDEIETEQARYAAMTRQQRLEHDIATLEEQVQSATAAWTTAKFNRDDVQIKETEERLVRLTTDLNALKMRRPV